MSDPEIAASASSAVPSTPIQHPDASTVDPSIPTMAQREQHTASDATELRDVVDDAPKRPKARHRIFRGISRIPSSPNLGLGHARAFSLPYSSPSSLSCISLSTASASSQLTSSFTPPYFSSISPLEDALASPGGSGSPSPAEWPFEEARVRQLGFNSPIAVLPDAKSTVLPELAASSRITRRPDESWTRMPLEIKLHVLSYLSACELVRLARVSKDFGNLCFDGQLWTVFDASAFYKKISPKALTSVLARAGPFVQDLNLRGCVQLEHSSLFADRVPRLCTNLHSLTLEGCCIKRSTLHSLLESNREIERMNLTGLRAVCNSTCRIIAETCPRLQMLNVSFCTDLDARGIKTVLDGCPLLTDLRASEVRGFNRSEAAAAIFRAGNLTRLTLNGCRELDDDTFKMMLQGSNPKIDILTDRPMVPPRKWRHLGLSYCDGITSEGVRAMGHLVPDLESLQLGRCSALTDAGLEPVLATTPKLTRLDLEDCALLTNSVLSASLAKAPCAPRLKHLTVSHCENLGDAGLMPVVRACRSLQVLEMDNTRASDLVICELSAMVRARQTRAAGRLPQISLRVVAYDCQNITWTGIREVLSCNTEVMQRPQKQAAQDPWRAEAERVYSLIEATRGASATAAGLSDRQRQKLPLAEAVYPTEIISIKCYYAWQQTVDEHTKRVLAGEPARASRLERSWAAWMQADEEQDAGGGGMRLSRRRRTRAREAQMVHADEEEGGNGPTTQRRRARTTSSCVVM